MSNGADIIKTVRLKYAHYRKEDGRERRANLQLNPMRRAELNAVERRISARRRALYRLPQFQNLAEAYADAYPEEVDEAANDMIGPIVKISTFKTLYAEDFSPQRLREIDTEQAAAPTLIAEQLRSLGAALQSVFRDRLEALALDIEREGRFALVNIEIGAMGLNLEKNIGRRGGASNPGGAWRALFIRETAQLLPKTVEKHSPYPIITALLTWAGIPGVYDQLVKSTLEKRSH